VRFLMKQISAISYVFSPKGAGSRKPGATPQVCPAWQTLALKARFIGDRLGRAFSAGGATTEVLGRCPDLLDEITPIALTTYQFSRRESIPAEGLDRDDLKPANRD
jgi:hypothetical protein